MSLVRSCRLICSSVLAITLATAAEAQDSPGARRQSADADTSGVADIVVTANRREERSQKVPISMTVLDSKTIQQNLRTSGEVAQLVPNIQLSAPIGFGSPRTSIRGVAQSDFNPNSTTSNMLYFDDIPLDAPISQGAPIWDLERVEVLRGPQGTLFGRNATGGAIRYISAMPKETPEGYAEFTAGPDNLIESRGAYGGPLTDTVKTRVSFVARDFGGDIKNVVLRTRQGKQRYLGLRGIVEWEPTDRFTAVLRGQHVVADNEVLSFKVTPGVTSSPFNFGPLVHYPSLAALQQAYGFQNLGYASNYKISESQVPPNEHLEHTVGSLNMDYDLGFATLTSVTGYLNVHQRFIYDDDATAAPILEEYNLNSARQFSQEVRLTSPTDGRFDWIAGAFYLTERIKSQNNFDATLWQAETLGGPFEGASTVGLNRGSNTKLDTYALFLNTNYEITPELKLTVSGRYTHERRRVDYTFLSVFEFPTAQPGTSAQIYDFIKAIETGNRGNILYAESPLNGRVAESWNNFSWKVGLDYQISPLAMVYGLVSRGFKGGNFPLAPASATELTDPSGNIISVDPETVTAYELGLKSDLVPGRVRFNVSAYYYDYKNYQTNQLDPAAAIQILSNLPKAEIYGVEAELNVVPVDHLTINLGGGLTHSEIKKALDPSLVGKRLPLSEDFNWNALARYDLITPVGTFSPQVSAKHFGSYYSTKENDFKLGNYTLVSARIGYESTNGKFYGALWATNLFDKVVPIAVDDPSEFFGSTLSNVNERRRYGVTAGIRF
jgi:iron complex outermembrane receptor protein